MKHHRTSAAILAALFATTSLTTGIAMAEQAKMPQTEQSQTAQAGDTQQTSQSQSDQQQLKMSQNASYAVRDIQMARIALHQDSADQAKSLLQDAKSKLEDASGDAITPDMLKKDASGGGKVQGLDKLTDASYFAVGSNTMISESVSTRQQTGTDQNDQTADASSTTKQGQTGSDQQKADASQSTGSSEKGRTIFRVDEIDMVEVAALLPHDATVKAIDQALTEIDNSNLQQAEQQLASVSDSMVFATLTERATPSTSNVAPTDQGSTQSQSKS
ncbi:YfdX family protein [Palleronia sp. LCG004]|uniref:YfdX family protein n=1 Tax=Palleronia sp. LCG004 TaxID=3079304 RepID=UPI00294273FD|nr:YfdX family protein [Palleronia sp. LCG004]WOI56474.1 YfdX family protein [Palleronia sp. LCG004]